MNLISSSWNWLTTDSAWNVPQAMKKMEQKYRDDTPSTLAGKIKIGLRNGVSRLPKRMLISALATVGVSYIFPPVTAFSPDCLALINGHTPSSLSQIALETLLGVVGEELVFRAGVQNLLQRLESASSPIMNSLGSLKNRTLISSTLFSVNHLNYYLLGNACSAINWNIVQIIRNLFDANYTVLYENYGIVASFSSHLVNNTLALVPVLIACAIIGTSR